MTSEPTNLRTEATEIGKAIIEFAMGVGTVAVTWAILFLGMLALFAAARGFHTAMGWLR